MELLAKHGYEMSTETSKNFADCLDKADRKNDPYFNKLVRIMATRCMHQAVLYIFFIVVGLFLLSRL